MFDAEAQLFAIFVSPARVTEFTGHAWDSLYRLAGLAMLLLDCVWVPGFWVSGFRVAFCRLGV